MDRRIAGQLLDALYGTDLQAPDWLPFFDCISQTFRSHVISLQAQDTALRLKQLVVAAGMSDVLQQRSAELMHEHLWFQRGTPRLLAEGVADDRGLATERELKSTRFYAELLEPARIGHGMALCLHRQGPADIAVMTINRDWSAGHYEEHELELAHTLLPHLRAVYALQQQLSWLDTASRSFRAALDQLADGVLLLDIFGRLLFCNLAAQRMEARQLFSRKPDGRLGSPWAADERALPRVLHQLGADAAAPVVQPLHNRDGRLVGMLKLCPAGVLAGAQWSEFRVQVIAFIKTLLPDTLGSTAALESQWHFTHAEAELAQSLMQGLSLDEAAEHLSVSKNTIRTQLRALFDKTDTRRQAELMRVLLRLSHG